MKHFPLLLYNMSIEHKHELVQALQMGWPNIKQMENGVKKINNLIKQIDETRDNLNIIKKVDKNLEEIRKLSFVILTNESSEISKLRTQLDESFKIQMAIENGLGTSNQNRNAVIQRVEQNAKQKLNINLKESYNESIEKLEYYNIFLVRFIQDKLRELLFKVKISLEKHVKELKTTSRSVGAAIKAFNLKGIGGRKK